jgi:hypothetical protein
MGDFVAFGRENGGKQYEDGMARTGLEYQTLADYKWVAERVEISLRNEKLESRRPGA